MVSFAVYLKVDPTGFPYELDVESKRMKGVKGDSLVLPLTEWAGVPFPEAESSRGEAVRTLKKECV